MIDNCFERSKRKVWIFICAVLRTFIAAYFVVLISKFICGIIENINGYEFPAEFAPYFPINYGLFEVFFTPPMGVVTVGIDFSNEPFSPRSGGTTNGYCYDHCHDFNLVEFSATTVAVITATQMETGYNFGGVLSPSTIPNGLEYAPTNGILAATNNDIGDVFADVRNTSNIKKNVFT